METFKGTIGDLEYYFKPQGGSEYLIEPYRHKLKPFRVIKRDVNDIDKGEKREWLIPPDENISKEIRSLELDFSDYIQEKLGVAN